MTGREADENGTRQLAARLATVMARAGHRGEIAGLRRLSGGANMQSWRFACEEHEFVLRRAPSAEWMASRSLTLAQEAAVIRHAGAGGVMAPQIVVDLVPEDAVGIGFVMRVLPGTADPHEVLAGDPQGLGGARLEVLA